jgi:5-phospho-D-xylono-1,4-lactonase
MNAMGMINKQPILTVRGYISPEELGFCHCHEHLFIADGHSAKVVPSLRIDSFDKTVAELMLFKSVGGKSIVDAQPIGCGRMPEALLKAAENTELNIIASTGFHKLDFYPEGHWIHTMSQEQFIEILIGDLVDGMYINCDTNQPTQRISARCGIIKTALSKEGIKGSYHKLFTAAAEASLATGSPIMCHTDAQTDVVALIDFFTAKGIPADAIIICHLDRTMKNPEDHLSIAKLGVFLEFDTIARFKYHANEVEADLVLNLIEKGYENSLLFGLDTTRKRLKSYGNPIGLDYIASEFLPYLKSKGLDEKKLEKLMFTNPARALVHRKTI